MLLHAQRQGLDAREDHEGIERRQRRSEVAQAEHTAGDRKGEIAEGLLDLDAVIFRAGLAQHRIFAILRPVEGAGIDDDAGDRVAVAAQKLRRRMHDDVRTMLDRADQVGRRQRVVDDQGHAGLARHRRDCLDIGDRAAGIGDGLDEDRLGARRNPALEAADIIGIGPHHVPAKALEGVGELVDRAAIEFSRGDEFVARHQELLQRHHLRGVAGGNRERRGAALERRDAFLQHGVGGIADAGIDVAERLQPEQRGGMVGVVEDKGCGLVDRRRPCAGSGIGLCARMHGKR